MREMIMFAVSVVHGNMVVAKVAISVVHHHCTLIVHRHGRCGLSHSQMTIVSAINSVMSTSICYIYRRMVLEKPSPVIVVVDMERPSSCLPTDGTIEIGQIHILCILPSILH